jgi:DNA-binding transcriptional ArsR family regulator
VGRADHSSPLDYSRYIEQSPLVQPPATGYRPGVSRRPVPRKGSAAASAPTTPAPPHSLERLEQVRVLAHPLRLRLLELFAEAPRTPKQAAERLGLPPTRLYHHVAALERVGLVRVKETRKNRGAVEKHYEAVARAFEMDPSRFARGRSKAARSAAVRLATAGAAALAMRVIERAGEGLTEALGALEALGGDLPADDPRGPLVLGGGIAGSPEEIAGMRDELLALVESWKAKAAKAAATGKEGSAVGGETLRAWLTIVLVPEVKAGNGKRSGERKPSGG